DLAPIRLLGRGQRGETLAHLRQLAVDGIDHYCGHGGRSIVEIVLPESADRGQCLPADVDAAGGGRFRGDGGLQRAERAGDQGETSKHSVFPRGAALAGRARRVWSGTLGDGKRYTWGVVSGLEPELLPNGRESASCTFPARRVRRSTGLGSAGRSQMRSAGERAVRGSGSGGRLPPAVGHRFIELKNSSLDLVFFILSSMNSIAASSSIGCSSFRRIQILASMSGSISRSSRRVPERLMSMAGYTRFSEIRRDRCTSMLPVPLNSS